MLTLDQAKEYLESIGIDLPDFLLELLFNRVSSIDECLAEHYDDATADMIKLYLLTLLSVSNGDRYVSSQTAPSGASQSFRYKTLDERWTGTYNLLSALDPYGCATPLIPPSPVEKAHAGVWIGTGGCDCGGTK